MRALFIALLLFAVEARAQSKTVILVFPIQDTTKRLNAAGVETLTDYLAGKIGETKNVSIIPRDELRKRLKSEQAETFKACYDESCQIELGRELAAGQVVATKIAAFGSTCIVTSYRIDLRKAATETTATVKSGCKDDDLLTAMESVSKRLMRTQVAQPSPPKPPPDQRYNAPMIGNNALDVCYHWGVECGEPAAGAWCRSKGFRQAADWNMTVSKIPTYVQGNQKVCSPNCGTFTYVVCTHQDRWNSTTSRRFNKPMANGLRLDICRFWGRDCGEPAASAWCKTQGYTRAISHSQVSDQPTWVLGDGKRCDKGCGTFSQITCGR